MNENRLKHSLAVARKMVEIATKKGMTDEDINNCFIIGFNHDIGYEYSKNGLNHNKIGGELLKDAGFIFWKEIYYHGVVTDEYESIYLDILNQADMQIDAHGNDVGYEARLEDIKSRYKESDVYNECLCLVNKIRDK